MEPGVNREWAYVVEDAGKASAVSREEAVARHGQASLVWVHLNGRDSGTLEWLRDRCGIPYPAFLALRSEEHTSELQSLMRNSYAVFCLKKKKEQQCTATILTAHYTI